MINDIRRLLDANFNRIFEALRVVEDTMRFLLDEGIFAKNLKMIRHRTGVLKSHIEREYGPLAHHRDVGGDPGRDNAQTEMRRKNIEHVFVANMARAKESARVLEEYLKLLDAEYADQIQNIRYEIYAIEAKISKLDFKSGFKTGEKSGTSYSEHLEK